jgi:hypothetical protein
MTFKKFPNGQIMFCVVIFKKFYIRIDLVVHFTKNYLVTPPQKREK